MQEKTEARLRESRLLAPSGREDEFTQPSPSPFPAAYLYFCIVGQIVKAAAAATAAKLQTRPWWVTVATAPRMA